MKVKDLSYFDTEKTLRVMLLCTCKVNIIITKTNKHRNEIKKWRHKDI